MTESINERQTTLSPGGVTRYGVNLKTGKSATIRTEFDGLAQALTSLQVGTELVLDIAARLPFAKTKSSKEALLAIDAAECVPKLLDLANSPDDIGRVGAMTSACIRPDDLLKKASRIIVGIVTGIVATLGGVISYLWTSSGALIDQVRSSDKYVITIGRAKVSELPGGCTGDVATRTVCEFVAAVLSGNHEKLNGSERKLAQTVRDLPHRPWTPNECYLEGDVTVVCSVEFSAPEDQGPTEPTPATFHLQPSNAEYDGDGGLIVKDGEKVDYEVVTYDGLGYYSGG